MMKFSNCGRTVLLMILLTSALFAGTLVALMGAAPSAHALISVAEKNARDARLKPHPSPSQQQARFKVVLDPGHGGIDHGTQFDGNPPVAEKDLTLMLARQVATQLRARGIEVVFTRDGDYEMPLAARTAMANKMGADVFLSIHLNSIHSRSGNPALAQGVETYILNHETDSTSKRLAQLENQVMGGGAAQQGDVALILKDLRLDASLSESKRLACMIQDRVVAVDPHSKKPADGHVISVTSNRGVRQALFFVLLGADMPSALIEAGFLSNPHDRDWLLSLPGQKAFGLAVARAINLFRMQRNTPLAQRTLSTCKVH
jgi:N-acetylmuramoyl-L-alanine amidase